MAVMRQLPLKVSLIGVMVLGSIAMWIATPVGWIYLIAHFAASSQVQLWHVVVIMIGIPLTMVVIGKALGALNRFYGRATNTVPEVRVRAPWHRSMRGEDDGRPPRTILDVVMVCSVGVALAMMGVWFLFFASGGGLPSS